MNNSEVDNIARIQAKLQEVSIGEFAKFVDFANNEFKNSYQSIDELTSTCVEYETKNEARIAEISDKYNQLISILLTLFKGFNVEDLECLLIDESITRESEVENKGFDKIGKK